ncbi:hypothetical protein ABE522_15660 [Stenotrophomonas pennii]|uniref:hypothetical protein n=1 Tax=Stenotrophomonas lacuserhaii TaxID=2760084 RepID=UPI003208A860
MQVSNAAACLALQCVKAACREPGRALTLMVAMLAGLRSVGAGPSGSRYPGLPGPVGVADVPASTAGDQWQQTARHIGAEVALCMRARHLAGIDPPATEAHCMGQIAFNRAMEIPFDPDQFREVGREAPDLDSEAGRYIALVERGMHASVTMVKPTPVLQNLEDAARLANGLPAVRHRIEHAAGRIIEDCNLRARVDNDALGQPGLFIRSDLDQVLREACSDGAQVPPTTLELRRANAALYFQSDRVKDERAFHVGQHRIHEGQASASAGRAFEGKVVDLVAERIGL